MTLSMSLKENTQSKRLPSLKPPIVSQDSTSSNIVDLPDLITTTTSDKTLKPKQFCSPCNIPVRNRDKHVSINKCHNFPFPYTNKVIKPTSTKKKGQSTNPGDNPAPSL